MSKPEPDERFEDEFCGDIHMLLDAYDSQARHLYKLRDENRRLERLEAAIRWALGERGEFRQRGENDGAYWWRKELRRRALDET